MADFQDLTSAAVAGAVAGDLAVAGIKLNDRIVLVQDETAGTANLVNEFTVKADGTINNTGGTSTNGHIVIVVWEKRYGGGRTKFDSGAANRAGRTYY